MLKIFAKESLAKETPKWGFKDGFDIRDELQVVEQTKQGTVVEFIGTGDFASAWVERQRFEVDAGRDEEPILYTPLYNVVEDSSLPRNVTVYRLGPGAVVFEEVMEGGEVKFVTVGESSFSVPIRHYATGLEYSKDLVIYNELWGIPIVERQAGIAWNAILNNIHLSPIIDATYAAANQTAASAAGATLVENYLRTIEDAITNSIADTTNPRRGPYTLLVSTSDLFLIERALRRVPQQGFDLQSSALSRIRNIIAYDGWTGSRGNFTTTYSGVTAGTAYLVDQAFRDRNFGSFVKQGLQRGGGNPDVSRFILEQVIWDAYLGVHADVIPATEEITWPT